MFFSECPNHYISNEIQLFDISHSQRDDREAKVVAEDATPGTEIVAVETVPVQQHISHVTEGSLELHQSSSWNVNLNRIKIPPFATSGFYPPEQKFTFVAQSRSGRREKQKHNQRENQVSPSGSIRHWVKKEQQEVGARKSKWIADYDKSSTMWDEWVPRALLLELWPICCHYSSRGRAGIRREL